MKSLTLIDIKILVLILILNNRFNYIESQYSLPKFNVNINEISVSGFSTGASFAVQLQVAYSSIIKGVGIVAGSVYDCARHVNAYSLCFNNNTQSISLSISQTNQWSGQLIDQTVYMRTHRVLMIEETEDTFAGIGPMRQLYHYYVTQGQYIPEHNVRYVTKLYGHTFPTDIKASCNIPCSGNRAPFISTCGYDTAGAILNHIYDNLRPRRAKSQRTGYLINFNQSEFISNPNSYGLDSTGYAYVPRACFEYEKCRLHIAFHGCFMSYFNIGLHFIQNTGYDLWADSNNIIVLFPQTAVDGTPHTILTNETFINTVTCWDVYGLYDPLYDTKLGIQMIFIKNIIDRITS